MIAAPAVLSSCPLTMLDVCCKSKIFQENNVKFFSNLIVNCFQQPGAKTTSGQTSCDLSQC